MDIVCSTPPARSRLEWTGPVGFSLRLAAWSIALFGLLRLSWIGAHVLLPATRLQAAAGSALIGIPTSPIEATLACSGADALALCLAVIAAYPARWRVRAVGLIGGLGLILCLNTLRIGMLGRAVASPQWFNALHLYIWPAVLTLAIGAYVFVWMRLADRRRAGSGVGTPADGVVLAGAATRALDWRVTGRFALLASAFLLIFTLAAPFYLDSARVLAVAGLVAHAAAFLLNVFGASASVTDSLLTTPRGAFLVTQECISTPLIPVYFAAVIAYPRSWSSRGFWMAAALPLFVALGVARLLVVALPAGLDASPLFLIHAFSQILVGAAMVCGLAFWRHGARAATFVRTAVALAIAFVFVRWLGAPYSHVILGLRATAIAFDDSQGALQFLPAFQCGLFFALWVAGCASIGWRRALCGVSLLAAMQVVVAAGVHALVLRGGIVPLVRDIRAWALLGPALVIVAVVNVGQARR